MVCFFCELKAHRALKNYLTYMEMENQVKWGKVPTFLQSLFPETLLPPPGCKPGIIEPSTACVLGLLINVLLLAKDTRTMLNDVKTKNTSVLKATMQFSLRLYVIILYYIYCLNCRGTNGMFVAFGLTLLVHLMMWGLM